MKSIKSFILCFLFTTITISSCDDDGGKIIIAPSEITSLDKSEVPGYDNFYQAAEFKFDMLNCNSKWSWWRSKQSEHFILFWAKEYGKYGLYADKVGEEITSPKTIGSSSPYYVDIDDLLAKAEEYYRFYVNELDFADVDGGNSVLNKRKIQIYLHHQDDWLATGAGYDNEVGALWISPSTCRPVGSTIAHEIAHCFQYIVYCDQLLAGEANDNSRAYRYNIGTGSVYWEQCAQWQSYQMYAAEAFTNNFSEFKSNAHKHFTHEDHRYGSYFLNWYWAEKHGVEVISQIWKNAKEPEDAIQTYMKIKGLSLDQMNQELYEYAAKCVTWDFNIEATNYNPGQITGVTKTVKEFGKNHIGAILWEGDYNKETHSYNVSKSIAPEATGFNHIRLNLPNPGSSLKVRFESIVGADGYGVVADASVAAWTVGFVELKEDGTRVYSPSQLVTSSADISYTPSTDASALWFVVAATPGRYYNHPWDNNNTNDILWPYSIKLEGTNVYGNVEFDGTETVSDVHLEYDIDISASAGYEGPVVYIEGDKLTSLAKAMVMQPTEIFAAIPENREDIASSSVKVAAVQEDGSLSYNYTAYGYGFWYDADGNIVEWEDGYIFMEFHPEGRYCYFGVHPGRVNEGNLKAGDKYSTSFALVYGDNKAVFTYNFTVVK